METEKVFDELRKIVAETERIFTVYKHTDPEGKVYIGYSGKSGGKAGADITQTSAFTKRFDTTGRVTLPMK